MQIYLKQEKKICWSLERSNVHNHDNIYIYIYIYI
jgi:hypothetical protein